MPTFANSESGSSVRTKINNAITKVDGIETGATADQTDAEILSAVQSESGRTLATDGTKLDGIESGATADQTGSELEASLDTELANTRWKVEEVPTGGTTGQVLKKNSGTNYDYSWADDSGGAGSGDSWGDAVDANIVASVSGTYNVGSATFTFAEGHFNTIYLNGVQLQSPLADPDVDSLVFWDDSAGSTDWLGVGNGITISGTSISADVQSVAGETGAITAADLRTALNVADGAEVNTIESVPAATGADAVLNVESLTTAEYTAATKVGTTLYLITDAT